jgi:hypothetical protein
MRIEKVTIDDAKELLSINHKPFLPEPYDWKTYGDMNVKFWEKHQTTPAVTVSAQHPAIMTGPLKR